jgi:alpha-beta hydrolase superfamily lysophospholipase
MTAEPTRLDFDSTGARIATYRWDPDGPPRAIAQIAHGVGEYALRYRPLVDDLLADGYVVYSHDHRAHGNSAPSPDRFGVLGEGGWVSWSATSAGSGSWPGTHIPACRWR